MQRAASLAMIVLRPAAGGRLKVDSRNDMGPDVIQKLMKAVIELENMAFRASHGCYELEKVVGNRFLVNVWIEADVDEAAREDDLSKSINYLTVFEIVRGEMEIPSNILEHVARRIVGALYREFPQILKTTVKVAKLAPPLGGKVESVSVTLMA